MVKKHIVILNWQFPPNAGIGGRRSAKLAKEWKNLGHEISILTQQTSGTENSSKNWINDEDVQAFDYFFIQKKNSFNALYFKAGLLNSALLWFLKKWHGLFTLGNPIDDCRFSGQEIAQQLKHIHKTKPIDLLFVSCAPFSLSVYAARFKILHPEVLVWCDFRDPWKYAVNYGLQLLNRRQLKSELNFQQEVNQGVDFISAPYQEILSEFESTSSKARLVLIPHFTDRKVNSEINSTMTKNPKFTYAGNLYEGALPFVIQGLLALQSLPSGDQPTLHFIGNIDQGTKEKMISNYHNIIFSPWMNDGLDHQLESSSGLIILLSDNNKDFHTTKFFDFLPLGKPYLYFGPKGKVFKTIEEHQLGCSIEQYHRDALLHYSHEKAMTLAQQHTANRMAKFLLERAYSG